MRKPNDFGAKTLAAGGLLSSLGVFLGASLDCSALVAAGGLVMFFANVAVLCMPND